MISDVTSSCLTQGYHKGKATQDPLPDIADDFWRMVWEQKSAAIVVLTHEKGKYGC